ncbi:hypothetical protein NW767_014966 [Fusarium falciforme]|nr:hypothetical protein NW767_014966 [Fusarium falciforme]
MDAIGTSEFARRRPPAWLDAFPLPPSSDAPRERRRPSNDLLDPDSDILIDFNSQEGFYEAAKKKKWKAQQLPPSRPSPPPPPVDDGQKDDNAGGDGGANGDDAAGGAGDGSGDGNNGGSGAGGDDNWAEVTTATSKKTGADGGLPAIPTNDFGADSFHEIKLGDDKLDLGLGPPELKNSFGSWGTKWSTGGTSWDWSGGGGGNDVTAAAAETKTDDIPWGKSKGAGKTNMSFGAIEEIDDKPAGSKQEKEDPWEFGSKKDEKKTSLWGAEDQEAKDGDTWGWGSKKKGKGGLLEEVSMDPEPAAAGDKKDIWDTWGISKKDRTKKRNIIDESHPEPAPDPPPADDKWGGWSLKRDKTKNSFIWDEQVSVPEPVPDLPSFEDKNDGDDFWSTFGTGKSKPTEEKQAEGWSSWGLTKKEPAKTADDGWDLWGTGKNKKAGDLIQLGDEIPPAVPDPVEAVGSEDFLDSWGFGGKKNNKPADPFAFKTSGSKEPSDEFWGSAGKKKPNPHDFLVESAGKIVQRDDVEEPQETLDASNASKMVLAQPQDDKEWGRHGDINPENILWFENYDNRQRDHLVISDFGLTQFNSAHSRSKVLQDQGSKVINDGDDDWGWASSSKTKKSKNRLDTLTDLPPPAPTPPDMDFTEPDELAGDPLADEGAAKETEEKAAREAEEAEAAAEDDEIAALFAKKAKRGGKLLKKDTERLNLLQANAEKRAEAKGRIAELEAATSPLRRAQSELAQRLEDAPRSKLLISELDDSDISDVESIMSDTLSLASSVTSVGEVVGSAITDLKNLLLNADDLGALFSIGISRVGADRFQRNIRRLLMKYGRSLRLEAVKPPQRQAAQFVRKYSGRIAAEIKEAITKNSDSNKVITSDERQHLNNYLDGLERDDEHDDEFVSSDEEFVDDRDDQLQALDAVKNFLISAEAFVEFRDMLRQWLDIDPGLSGDSDIIPEIDPEKGADVEAKDESGRTPLSWATARGDEAVVKLLLDTGKVHVDPKGEAGRMPLSLVVQHTEENPVTSALEGLSVPETVSDAVNESQPSDQTEVALGAMEQASDVTIERVRGEPDLPNVGGQRSESDTRETHPRIPEGSTVTYATLADASINSETSISSESPWSQKKASTMPSSVSTCETATHMSDCGEFPSTSVLSTNKETTDDHDTSKDGIQSIASIDGDITSTADSGPVTAPQRHAAVNYLVKMLTKDEELTPLYELAFRSMDRYRFQRNHRRLLWSFVEDLRLQRVLIPSQDITISFLGGRRTRNQLSLEIFNTIKPAGDTDRERINQLTNQERDHRFALNRFLEDADAEDLPDLPVSSTAESYQEAYGVGDDESDDKDEEKNEDQYEDILPKLQATWEFLCAGPAFAYLGILVNSNLTHELTHNSNS